MKQKFDYIIIGAGTAGCILANRLSANPEISVLVVEAGGPDKKLEIKLPGGYGKLHKSEVDWGFSTEPQEHVNDRKLYLPRGKTLGGCSSTNAMAYVRGNKEDYDEWASMGNQGWGYHDVLPYFKKSEGNVDIKNEFHNQSGPVHIGFAKYFRTPFAEAFIAGCQEALHLPLNEDYNGAEQTGTGFFQFNIKDGKRWSMADAFLKPVLHRKNLTILTHTSVSKLLIKNDKVEGIECVSKSTSTPELMYCNKEVILSAGSFQSPQLLMISGIGDKKELKFHGIESKLHLPGVGKNLQDHLFYFVSSLANKQLGVNHHLRPQNQLLGLAKWLFTNGGAMSISPLEAFAFYKVLGSPEVNMQFHFTPLQIASKIGADPYDLSTFPTVDGYTILPSLLKPKSIGHLSLKSKNPYDYPLIQPNFLSHEDDLKTLVKGGQDAIKVLQSTSMSKYNKSIIAPSNHSEDGLIQHIKQSLETIYHPVGTCKMGNDDMSVVDEQLRVYGIEGLRVADASIMPRIVAGNTNAPVMMIAEKAADMILQSKP
jgi:choline dehydrogenase